MRRAHSACAYNHFPAGLCDVSRLSLAWVVGLKMYARRVQSAAGGYDLYATNDRVRTDLQARFPLLRYLWGKKRVESGMSPVFDVLNHVDWTNVRGRNVGRIPVRDA